MEKFEPVRLGSCESCDELTPLNEDSMCQSCDERAQVFNTAARRVRYKGGTREAAYKAGMKAVEALIKIEEQELSSAAAYERIMLDIGNYKLAKAWGML